MARPVDIATFKSHSTLCKTPRDVLLLGVADGWLRSLPRTRGLSFVLVPGSGVLDAARGGRRDGPPYNNQ